MNRILNLKPLAALAAGALALFAVGLAHGSPGNNSSGAAKSVVDKAATLSTSSKPVNASPSFFKWRPILTRASSGGLYFAAIPHIEVSGHCVLENADEHPVEFTFERLFTWSTNMSITGGGFAGGESVDIVLHGPLNSRITPFDRTVGTLVATGAGTIVATDVLLPFDPQPIIRPGYYEVRGVGGTSGTVIAADKINICPATLKNDTNNGLLIDWGRDRGGRDGPLTSIADQAPERIDPDWVATWDEIPVQVYGTIEDTNSDGNNQPSLVAYHDFPNDHYAHDINYMLVPDPEYRWLLGTRNYLGGPDGRETGRMEVETEFLNDGKPSTYNTGKIGLPPFVMATGGDKVFIVGRWILDMGHPDTGARTEIHPARMVATMRKRSTVIPLTPGSDCMTRAQQVDVYVTPHGGGANRFLRGLTDALNNGGLGGGRITDALSASDVDKYYRAGPISDARLAELIILVGLACLFLPPPLDTLCVVIEALLIGSSIYEEAGPSAMGWGAKEPELGVVNDMDYDFDVKLLDPPTGATSVQVEVTPQVNDSGAVNEVITYTDPNPATGLPTKAHVHLPYLGAANDIYSRTLKFAWNTFNKPARHFRVDEVSIEVTDDSDLFAGSWHMFLDVCGQWQHRYSEPSTTFSDDSFRIEGSHDVYVDANQTLRVTALGYEGDNLESGFGSSFGDTAYDFVFTLLNSYFLYDFSGDNDDLGGAHFEGFPLPTSGITGTHIVSRDGPDGNFKLHFNVTYIPYPPRIDLNGVPTDFGNVAIGNCRDRVISIFNTGEEDLDVSQITVSGAGYTRLGPNLPITVQGGSHVDVTVRFCPTAPGQGAGTITFDSTDPCRPTQTFDLHAVTTYPTISATPASTVFEPTVVGCSTSQLITVFNTGNAELLVNSATISGTGYSLAPVTLPIHLAANASTNLAVTFTPTSVSRAFNGTLTMTTNDPFHPTVTNTFCGEGVNTGIRVIVLQVNGTPYTKVDQITIQSHGITPNTNTMYKNTNLTTIVPATSCLPIQFHVEKTLPPSGTSTSQGSYYNVKAKVGNKQQSISLTLQPCSFKIVYIKLQ